MPTEWLRGWRPKKIDRYLLQGVLGAFLGSFIFLTFILFMFQMLRLADFFILHGASIPLLGKMSLFMILSFLPLTIPISFLLGVLFCFSRLSMDNEIVALKASGISLVRLSLSCFVLAFFLSLLSVVLNNTWVPWVGKEFKKTIIKLSNTKIVSNIREGMFTTGFFDLLIFADHVDSKTNQMHKVFIYDEREPKSPMTYIAKEGAIIPMKTQQELGSSILLRLSNGSTHHNRIEDHTYERMDFKTYHLFLEVTEGADTTLVKPNMIPYEELLEKIKATDLTTYAGREFRGEYWRRYCTAWSPLVFIFLGIGFGTFRTRAAKTGALITGFGFIFIYWLTQTLGTLALQKDLLHPFWAMQCPNLLLLSIGLYRFRKAAW
ncbi:MAG: LptF/LptG family permease [Bdellovibrionia bacterium]